jgi:hypothetical protein
MSLDRPVCPYCNKGIVTDIRWEGYERFTTTGPCYVCGGPGKHTVIQPGIDEIVDLIRIFKTKDVPE